MKWRYLTYNQKMAFGFAAVIAFLVLLNVILFSQYMTKSREVVSQNKDKPTVVTDNLDTKVDNSDSTSNLKNLPSNSVKSKSTTSSLLSELDDSIRSIDDVLVIKDADIELPNLIK
jgi:hypothetical protein